MQGWMSRKGFAEKGTFEEGSEGSQPQGGPRC